MLYTPSAHYMPRKPTAAKLALKPVHVWGIRVRLQVARQARDLALFDLALDSKLRGCGSCAPAGLRSPLAWRRETPRRVPEHSLRILQSSRSAGQREGEHAVYFLG